MTSSASYHLKKATANSHRLAENSLINRLLFSPEINIPSYTLALERYYGIVAPLENLIKDCQACNQTGYVFRAAWLHEELLALGRSTADIMKIPSPDSLPAIKGETSMLGIAYVLEGSRSGGPIIRKKLLKHLDQSILHKKHQNTFFENRDIQEVRASWQKFKQQLDDWFAPQTDTAFEHTLLAACQTFDLFADWLNRPLQTPQTIEITSDASGKYHSYI